MSDLLRFAKIIDRVMNIVKLSQGEYVVLGEDWKRLHIACPLVRQICIQGNSMQSYLLAIVVPDPVVLAKVISEVWKKRVGEADSKALDETVKDERVLKVVLDILTKDGVRYGVQGYVPPPPLHLG